MSRRRSPRRDSRGQLTRRGALAGLGAAMVGGGAVTSFGSQAVNAVTGDRASNVALASDPNAYVGLDRSAAVKKNEREPLVYIENPLSATQTVTVTINSCADDILYNPSDEQANCQITGTVGGGQTGRFDIEAQQTGTLEYSIEAESVQLRLNADRTVDVESGNVKGAVYIQGFSDLTADTAQDEWGIKKVHVKDDDGDDDLDRVEIEVQDGDANRVGTETFACGCGGGSAFNPSGNPSVTVQPDDPSYTVDPNETYQATVFGYDADGNFDTDTVTTNE